jgi:hypothetical protein
MNASHDFQPFYASLPRLGFDLHALPFRVSDCRHEAGLIALIPHLIIISDDTARHCPGSPFPFPFPFPSTSFSSLPATHHQLAPPVHQPKQTQPEVAI